MSKFLIITMGVIGVLCAVAFLCRPTPAPQPEVSVTSPACCEAHDNSPAEHKTTDPAVADFVKKETHTHLPQPHIEKPHLRVTPDQTSRLPRVKNAEDLAAVAAVLRDPGDDDTVRHEAAELLRRSGYTGIIDDLNYVLANPKEGERFRSWAVQHLHNMLSHLPTDAERQNVRDIWVSLLQDRHVSVRAETLLALCRTGDPKGAETAIAWLNDPRPEFNAVRYIAIRCVHDLDLRAQISAIRTCLKSGDEHTRTVAMVALSDWRDQSSRGAFEAAASSANPRLQRVGNSALARLSTVPIDPARPYSPQTAGSASPSSPSRPKRSTDF